MISRSLKVKGGEIKEFLESNENESTSYQNVLGTAQKESFWLMNIYINKAELSNK
jgi:hypothetical protein